MAPVSALPPREAGVALVIVLWLVALLSLLAIGQTATVRTETLVTGNQIGSAKARAATYGGIQLGLLELLRPPQARTWHADGAVHSAALGGATLQISLADEAGKVDINFASGPLFDELLRAAGVDEDERLPLVDAILDWRDPDPLRRANGAEEDEYQAAGLEYGPGNGPFQGIEELALVLGMKAALYHTLADSITVHSGNPTFNPAAVTGRVLRLMLDGGAVLDDINDALEGETDDTALPLPAVSRAESAGRVFTIRCAAYMSDGVREKIEAVVRLTPARGTGAPLHEIVVWREGEWSDLTDRVQCVPELGC